ncbi:TetR/AcrR family transcriptional regulator [Paenarthrobacter aurescens]|uniref:TetR/AcrR family transcriptional regulator n=1 Tax=Paenarthrobacter aurescens TaxID=43663 RepID=UPI0021C07351|nr:TetR/AcrR family transcriptional regulator [Paenarthrobacter aurescens]MCT9868695.1 TetR/AcrR family transcriptional regulator [Paenarthrobacter aurescens]
MPDTAVVADRRPGRPRDTALESTVLSSTVELLLERDTRDVTVSAITERSGVSRAALYRRWSSREELIAAALDSVRSSIGFRRKDTTLETILASYEEAAIDVDGKVGALVKKRVAMGLENDELRALSWNRHVSRRREPIAAEIRHGITSGELSPDVDVESMIDLINGLYYYQFVVRPAGTDAASIAETRERVRNAVKLVWDGALRR